MIRPRLPLWSTSWRLGLLLGACLAATAQITPTITKYSDISLGSIVPGATAGTVALNYPAGDRTATGGTSLGTSVGATLGRLTLTGQPGNNWQVTSASTIPFTLTRAGGGGTMQVTFVAFDGPNPNTGTFPASGTTGFHYLNVTASVGTAATVPMGTYTGSFTLRVRDTNNGRTSTTVFAVTARVDPVISIVKLTDLRFGDVYTGATPGTVILTPAGARTVTGGTGLGNVSPVGPATFTVTGGANATYAITLPATITLIAPGGTLTVSPFSSSPSATGALGATGQQTLAVGGTLNVGANLAEGNYAGTFAVTVYYN